MPTKVVREGRRLQSESAGNGGNGHVTPAPQKSGDAKMQLVSQEIMRLVDASREAVSPSAAGRTSLTGSIAKSCKGVNEMLDAILLPIGEGNRILAQISSGKIDELIAQTYKGDHEKMKQAVNNVAIVVQGLQKEMARLTDASKDGQLSDRGKPEQFQGAYAEIVRGVNTMLDAILLPIGEGNRILAQMSNGKIDELIAQTYKGDHEKMKQAINNVAGVVQSLQKELARLTDASKEGQLSDRGKPGAVPGCLRRDRARRQYHAGRHPAAHRRRQPHPRSSLQRQDRRTDCPDLQGRSREDEAGDQQRRHRPARSAEGNGCA